MRLEVDQADAMIIYGLQKRKQAVEKIGQLKKEFNQPALDVNRFQEMLKKRIELGEKLDLDRDLIQKLYQSIHDYSVKIQK